MGRRGGKKSSVNKDAWLGTYADMITLILVFFILLYSMSTIDQTKFRLLVKAFTADKETIEQIRLLENDNQLDAGNPDAPQGGNEGDELADVPNLDELYQYLKSYVEQNNLQSAVQVTKDEDTVLVRFMSTLFFEADRAVLKQSGVNILGYVGDALHDVEPRIGLIRIDGHTAEAPPGTSNVDDRQLSTDRANTVLKFLEDNYIEDPSKLIAVGYGMYRPVSPNDTEMNRAKNRRVEILISETDPMQDALDKLYQTENSTDGTNVTQTTDAAVSADTGTGTTENN